MGGYFNVPAGTAIQPITFYVTASNKVPDRAMLLPHKRKALSKCNYPVNKASLLFFSLSGML